MAAAEYNFTIEQGANLSIVFTWYDSNNELVDLNSYTGRLKAKINKSDTATVIDSTANETLTLGGVLGTVTWTMTAAQTAALTFNKAYYDIELILSGVVTRFMEGMITNSKEVTN